MRKPHGNAAGEGAAWRHEAILEHKIPS